MIDSGANGNFISSTFVKERGIATRQKRRQDRYTVTAVDGSPLPGGDTETMPVLLQFQQHHEEIVLDVICMAKHDVVLGMPWLKQHNPTVDWREGAFSFDQCECVTVEPERKQRFAADEVREFNRIQPRPPGWKKQPPTVSDTSKGQQDQNDDGNRGPNAPPDIPEVYSRWKRLFQEEEGKAALPKHQKWDHKIPLLPGKDPTFGPIYSLSEKELKTSRENIDKDLARGFIRKSTSPAGHPILFVPKKDGSLRQCVDYRKLNNITVKNRYPLPNASELQDRLSKAKWFTLVDLKGAYNLIRMAEGEEWKTAFRTRYGLYEYLVMPFGLTNAPASCQEMMNDILKEFLDITVVVYLDDILIYTDGPISQHVEDVKKVLEALMKWNLKANPAKCLFHRKEVPFLGYIVGVNGIKIDPDKTESVRNWPTPRNVKDVQSFLGFANYNRKFVKNYSRIAIPLTTLTRKDIKFIWEKVQQEAFDKIKEIIVDKPTLKMFDGTKPIQIETDASDRAVGACLTQEYDGKRCPIAYYSRKLSPTEENYDIHDKELLAVVAALTHWRVYCEGAPGLTVFTDHKNLLYFTTTKQLNRRQTRWSELLGQYKFEIKYTPGKDNNRADALSRRSDYMDGKEPVLHSILKVNADGSLSANPQEFNAISRILRDDQEQFPIEHGKYQVPHDKEEQCIRDHHDGEVSGHPGIARTLERIQRKFAFPSMRQKVIDYIKKCSSCQKNKASRHAKYGNLQMITPPKRTLVRSHNGLHHGPTTVPRPGF